MIAEYLLAGPHFDEVVPFFDATARAAYLVPDTCVVEVADVIRQHLASTGQDPGESASIFADFKELEPVVFGSLNLVEETFSVSPELAARRAAYVVLARKLGVPLCTLDSTQAREARQAGVWLLEPGTPRASSWPPIEFNGPADDAT